MSSGDFRNSASLNTKIASTAATANGSHAFTAGTPSAARIVGRSDVAAPSGVRSKRQTSSAFVRQTANNPRSVMYAAMPIITNTIHDFKFPAPARISVLLPQPDASVIPKPKRNPPTMAETQATRAPVKIDLFRSTLPVSTRIALPAMATAIASTHIRMRCQLPKFTMSAIAPIVQKLTRLATAPNTNASANASEATSSGSLATSAGSMDSIIAPGAPAAGTPLTPPGTRPR